jgi:hypothetical protein
MGTSIVFLWLHPPFLSPQLPVCAGLCLCCLGGGPGGGRGRGSGARTVHTLGACASGEYSVCHERDAIKDCCPPFFEMDAVVADDLSPVSHGWNVLEVGERVKWGEEAAELPNTSAFPNGNSGTRRGAASVASLDGLR